jgi:hypothetical protein
MCQLQNDSTTNLYPSSEGRNGKKKIPGRNKTIMPTTNTICTSDMSFQGVPTSHPVLAKMKKVKTSDKTAQIKLEEASRTPKLLQILLSKGEVKRAFQARR